MSHQPQGLLTTSIPYFLLAFACTTTRALFIPSEHLKVDPEPGPHGVLGSQVKRQDPSSSSFSFSTRPIGFTSSFSSSSFSSFFDTTSTSTTIVTPVSFPISSSSFSSSSFSNSDDPFITSATSTTDFSPTGSATASIHFFSALSAAGASLTSGSFSLATISETSLPTSNVNFGVDRSSNSAIPIVIGTIIGCLIALSLVFCLLCLRKRRRRQLQETERLKVEKAFGSEAGFHLLVDTGSDPTRVNPYIAPPTSQPSINPDEKSHTFENLLTVPATQSSTGTSSGSSAPSSPVSDYPTPTSAISQQSLLEQLNILRAQIQHVEALAGISTSGSSNAAPSTQDSSEPPPEYDANLGDARSRCGTEEKGADLP